jgi:transposase-like protein
MPNRYTPAFKKHHVEAWQASGLTRRQYCASQGINESTFKHWRAQMKATSHTTAPAVLPVQVTASASAPAPDTSSALLMLYLPQGYRLACQPAQLADVLQALKYAEA